MNSVIDKHYIPTSASHWTGRQDSLENERFFQIVNLLDLNKKTLSETDNGVAIIGFQCDEGVKRNLGRVGAKLGPDKIRDCLGSLPLHRPITLVDLGNIQCINDDLEGAQEALARLVSYAHEKKFYTVVLGGGHEIAWGHYLGLKEHYPELAIINFDAHFDLRQAERASSGTPFLQIAQDKKAQEQPFNYCCIGIQKTANTPNLFETADTLNVPYLTASSIHNNSIAWQQAYLDDFLSRHNDIYLSLCLDVFSQSSAPGVSAPQPFGLTPREVMPLLNYILDTGKLVSMDIAELSPPFDIDNCTARLASHIAAALL
jgi:formiminoglutamase